MCWGYHKTINIMIHEEELQLNGYTYKIQCIHTGQYHPYGDTFRVFNIITDDKDESHILEVMKVTNGYDVPEKKDWNPHQIDSYFRGYCEIEKTDYGWKYTKCEPYTD